jgi:hypothetical protein
LGESAERWLGDDPKESDTRELFNIVSCVGVTLLYMGRMTLFGEK